MHVHFSKVQIFFNRKLGNDTLLETILKDLGVSEVLYFKNPLS